MPALPPLPTLPPVPMFPPAPVTMVVPPAVPTPLKATVRPEAMLSVAVAAPTLFGAKVTQTLHESWVSQ